MNIKYLIYLFLSSCVLLANAQTALHGLFTPVQLQPEQTTIFLRDYLVDEKAVSVELPKGLYQINKGTDTLMIGGKMMQKMGVLTVNTASKQLHLVLINASARQVNITVSAQQLFGKEVRIIGAFNNWNRGSEILDVGKGVYSASYTLEPGAYEYKFFVDGKEILDPNNPEKVANGMGGFNNILRIKPKSDIKAGPYRIIYATDTIFDPDDARIVLGIKPALQLLTPIAKSKTLGLDTLVDPDEPNVILAIDTIYEQASQPALNGYLVLWNNQQIMLPCTRSMFPTCNISIPAEAKKIKRSYIRIFSYVGSDKGRDQLIPLEYGEPVTDVSQLERSDWHQARMYFLMVDRFYNGNTANDLPTPDTSIKPIANYMGGDLEGVNQKIASGFFKDLGTNTIWLSPITQNPYDAWGLWNKGKVHSTFSGYHGYWPISNKRIDTRFGNPATVKNLLNIAHLQNQNVVLDYVANHVHINHPIYKEHKDWATDLYLPDGTKNTEKWDEHRLTTWFDDHLATLDLRRYEVVDPMADSALFWLTNYNFDGFRHDATKHIDELYWRTLTYRIKRNTTKPIFQIGETYGSPQLINSYISTGILDAQFDFNLYDAAVNAFASDSGDVQNLIDKTRQALTVYGYHHLMGNITGNQDRTRFITLASGDVKPTDDAKLVGWDTEIGKPSAEAYKRLAFIHAFNNAIPGIPCIYYGDEYGLPGAGDPDNRRMMRFDGYDADEKALLNKVKKLNTLRGENLALLYGSTEINQLENGLIEIKRVYLSETVLIYLNPTNRELLSSRIKINTSFSATFSSVYKIKNQENSFAIAPLSFDYIIEK